MKYKYGPFISQASGTGDVQTFPIVNVTLRNGRNQINIDCLIDSGASESLFNEDIAELLGIDLTKATPEKYVGIGDINIDGYKSSVMLKLSGFEKWIKFEAGFVSQNEMPLLGHSGFFENYEITFRAYQSRFEIKNKDSQ